MTLQANDQEASHKMLQEWMLAACIGTCNTLQRELYNLKQGKSKEKKIQLAKEMNYLFELCQWSSSDSCFKTESISKALGQAVLVQHCPHPSCTPLGPL